MKLKTTSNKFLIIGSVIVNKITLPANETLLEIDLAPTSSHKFTANSIIYDKTGDCTVETGFIWTDLLTDFERVSDHCSNIAVGIIDVSEHTMNAHEVIKHLKQGNARYSDQYTAYSEKYAVEKL